MKSSSRTYKRVLSYLFIAVLIIIFYLTLQAISETRDWSWLYTNQHNIISAYGTLIGGVLAFLSILFVLYQVYEQREQILEEKIESAKEVKEEYFSRLRLLNSFLSSLLNNIDSMGGRLLEFYEKEKAEPGEMHLLYFNVNSNFRRVIEMDVSKNYEAIQVYFEEDEEWEKLFLNLYQFVDFYSGVLEELKMNFKKRTEEKVSEKKLLGKKMEEFINDGAHLIDKYFASKGGGTYLSFPWSSLANNTLRDYHLHLQDCARKNEVPNFRFISDNIFLPFIDEAMKIRKAHGYDSSGSRELVTMATTIRKKTQEIEVYSLQYAGDLEKQYNAHFKPDSENFSNLKEIKDRLDAKLKG